MSDRRSLASIASGIYEEIPDVPAPAPQEDNIYCKMSRDSGFAKVNMPDVSFHCCFAVGISLMYRTSFLAEILHTSRPLLM